MASDNAARDLDMSGFRILRIGDPTVPGSATRTDNAVVPGRARDTGAGGTSLLASPADHVHPETGTWLSFSDPALVSSATFQAIWFAVIDFDNFIGDTVQIGLAGMLAAALMEVSLDGQLGNPRSGTLVMNISTDSPTLVPIAGLSSAPFAKPAGAHLLTMTSRPILPNQPAQSQARSITLRGRFA